MPRITDPDIFFETIPQLNARLKAKEFRARDLVEAVLDRLERLGPRYNAVAHLMPRDAVRQAREVEAEMGRERYRGPLQGIPFGVKDLASVAGHPTTWGARPFAEQVFREDAAVVARLKGTGAIPAAKLSMIELAGGGGYRYASASLTGPARNPWDTSRWAGGSSSGSGAAVAAGLVPFALGSETWGSILTPCAYCGLTGLRPTYGLVSRRGAMALSWTMDKIGPMCRSVEDCALVLQQISGGDRDDPGSAGRGFFYTPQFARKFEDLTIGFAPVDFTGWAEPAARPAFEKAFGVIKELGTKIVETELPDFPYSLVAGTVIDAEGSAVFEPHLASGALDELADQRQIAGLKAGLEVKAKDYLKAMRIRALIQQELRVLFRNIDILVSPARFGPATPIDQPLDRSSRPQPEPVSRGLRDLSAAGNLAGLPALCLPCGFAEGLPVALQLVGRPYTENNLIAVGKEFQARTKWHLERPPA